MSRWGCPRRTLTAGSCLDHWAESGPPGDPGPAPSGRSSSAVPGPWAPGSGIPETKVLLALSTLAHHLALPESHPPSQDHQEAELRAAQALGLIIKGTCCLDSLAGCDRSGFASASLSVPGRLLVLYPSPGPASGDHPSFLLV